MTKRFSHLFNKTLGLWREGDNLSTRVARSSAISLLGRLVIKLTQFAKTIILARLLFPADFGLFSIAAVAITITDTFLQTGFYQALIQEKDDPRRFFNTAWTIGIIRGATSAVVTFLAAPFIASFFNVPEAVPLIRVLALAMFIIGFENVAIINFQREFNFSKKFALDFSIVIAEIGTVIFLASLGFGVWSLVLGSVMNRIVSVILSFWFIPYRLHLEFNPAVVKSLFKYGKWITAGAVVSFLLGQGDYLTIAKLLGTESLGFYQLAFTLATLPAVEVVRVIGNILFPLYSKLSHNVISLRQTFIKATRVLLILPVPAAIGLILLRTQIVGVVYGNKWLPMAPIWAVLAVYGLFKSFDAAVQPFFLGSGRPKHATAIMVWQGVFMFAGILPLTYHFGAVGTALAVLIGMMAAVIVELWFLRQQINLGFQGLLAIWIGPLLSSTIMALVVYISHQFWPEVQAIWLSINISIGILSYFVTLVLYDKYLGRKEIVDTISWFKKSV